jgi:hypothetical protein
LDCFVAVLLAMTTLSAADSPKLLVFDFELMDTSLQGEMNGPRAVERERLLAPNCGASQPR